MCGIFGTVNHEVKLEEVYNILIHRGPDNQSSFFGENICFHHFRLAIQDVVGGEQPMHYLERYTIIYNGEIYNHFEIRKRYKLKCYTNSDTETLLQLFHLLGKKCLDVIDGMFAFAIYDKCENKIFFGRDRAGKKPLFIYHHNQKLIFSSEINAIHQVVNLEPDSHTIAEYFRLGSILRQSAYQHVLKLGAGQFAEYSILNDQLKISEWWSIDKFYYLKSKVPYVEAKIKVHKLLENGVHRRIDSSDLDVGCFLSGGIDSGLVTAIAAKYTENLKTFTVSFKGQYDESNLSKLVAEKYKTTHTTIPINFNHLDQDVEDIISRYGEPFFDSSCIPSYYVSREAKKYITVVLNGDGADELFGGYRRYVPFANYDFFNSSKLSKNIFKLLSRLIPFSDNKMSKLNFLNRLVNLGCEKEWSLYLSSTSDIFEGFPQAFYEYPNMSSLNSQQLLDIINSNELSGLDKMLNLDFNILLFSDLLPKMDIATMANSLEGRSPFLCKELLEYIPTLNNSFKTSGLTTKRLLRDLAKQYLPGPIVNQPKRGFEIPLKQWINDNLRDQIFDRLNNRSAFNQYIKWSFVDKLLHRKISVSEEKRAKMIWALYCHEVWYHKCYLNAKAS